MKKIIKCKTYILMGCILLLGIACVLLSIWGTDMKQHQDNANAEKRRLAEQYEKQNRAFSLRTYEWYLPYAELRNSRNESALYTLLRYYCYTTGRDLSLEDVWEYLSVAVEYSVTSRGNKAHRGEIREYTFYPKIQEYVEFMDAFFDEKNTVADQYVQYFGYNVQDRYGKLLDELYQVFDEAIELKPDLSKYGMWDMPFQLKDELVHKVVDPAYQMNLEITDERNYMFLTPEAIATGVGNE